MKTTATISNRDKGKKSNNTNNINNNNNTDISDHIDDYYVNNCYAVRNGDVYYLNTAIRKHGMFIRVIREDTQASSHLGTS
eukprot:975083-Heterocapsa_arctica.AAC.1